MRNVMLEQLYNGNVGPAHMPTYETESSKYYSEKADGLEEQLETLLDDQGRKLLRKMQEMKNAASCALTYGCFSHGFKMATLIMVEVFMDKESEVLDKDLYWLSRLPQLADREK